MNLQTGAFGDPTNLKTLILFWTKMELLHYPGASDTKAFLEQEYQQQQEQMQQQMAMQQAEALSRREQPGWTGARASTGPQVRTGDQPEPEGSWASRTGEA